MRAMSLGLNMTVGVIVFAGFGYYWDTHYGRAYNGTLVGIFVGLFLGGYEVWKIVQEWQKTANHNQNENNES